MISSYSCILILLASFLVGPACKRDSLYCEGEPHNHCSLPVDAAVDAAVDALTDAPSRPHKKRITIDRAKVYGDQTQFPVWIVLPDDGDLKAGATNSGDDIYFTKPDSTPLEYQIQSWSSSTGRLEAWVRTDLADNSPTLIDLHYGDLARKQPQNPPTVFSNSFAAVWHLDDEMVTTTIADAKNLRDGIPMGLADAGRGGQLGRGIQFDGDAKQITFANPYTNNGPHTISAWVNQQTATGPCDMIVAMGTPMTHQSRWFESHHTQGDRAAVGFFGNDWFYPGPGPASPLDPPYMNLEGDGWVLVHWVFEGQSRMSRLYRDGVQVDTYTHSTGINTQGTMGYIGNAPGNWAGGSPNTCALTGSLDEVRLATVARTASWIKTEFENQKSPTSFYSVGPEEMGP